MSQLTFGSLFSGIGGLDLGFERAGMVCKWQVEINQNCRSVLEKNFPEVDRNITDVRQAGINTLESVDIICGGFPCQDISQANIRGRGLSGQKSGLWWEFHRIIGELQPKYAIMENVSNLVRRGLDRLLGGLAEIGYDAEWKPISAAAFGFPHLRERLFIVAYPNNKHGAEFSIFDGASIKAFTKKSAQGISEWRSRWVTDGQGNRRIRRIPYPGICRIIDGVPGRVDRYEGLGNAVPPIMAEFIATLVLRQANKHLHPTPQASFLGYSDFRD